MQERSDVRDGQASMLLPDKASEATMPHNNNANIFKGVKNVGYNGTNAK